MEILLLYLFINNKSNDGDLCISTHVINSISKREFINDNIVSMTSEKEKQAWYLNKFLPFFFIFRLFDNNSTHY